MASKTAMSKSASSIPTSSQPFPTCGPTIAKAGRDSKKFSLSAKVIPQDPSHQKLRDMRTLLLFNKAHRQQIEQRQLCENIKLQTQTLLHKQSQIDVSACTCAYVDSQDLWTWACWIIDQRPKTGAPQLRHGFDIDLSTSAKAFKGSHKKLLGQHVGSCCLMLRSC